MTYLDLGYNEYLEVNSLAPDFSQGINASNVGELIGWESIGLNQTEIGELYSNENIQTNNFSAGSAGWQILGSGSAEFTSGTFTGTLNASETIQSNSYVVADLPTASPTTAGSIAYASDGRKAGEGAGSGTGVLVFYDGSNWIACDTGATVSA